MMPLLRNAKWRVLLAVLVAAGLLAYGSVQAHYLTKTWGPKTVSGVTIRGDLALEVKHSEDKFWGASVSTAYATLEWVGARNRGRELCNGAYRVYWDNERWTSYGMSASVTGFANYRYWIYCQQEQILESRGWFYFQDRWRNLYETGETYLAHRD